MDGLSAHCFARPSDLPAAISCLGYKGQGTLKELGVFCQQTLLPSPIELISRKSGRLGKEIPSSALFYRGQTVTFW